jgi:ribosomal protein S12 methylthiotransferase
LDVSSIVKKAEALNRQGVRELNIIGQDITGYGIDLYKTPKLTGILKKVVKIATDVKWIRLLYLYPSRVTDDLIKIIREEPKICKYIDLPIQHINNRILNLMRRQTKKEDIVRLVDKIRKQIPRAAIRTSLIVGFPSESDKEFQELLEFIKEVKFERLGAFIYSREEGTGASRFPGQIPKETKMARFNAVMSCQQQISREVNQGFLAKTMNVLIDERAANHCSVARDNSVVYLGRSQYDAPEVDGLVYVKSKRQLKAGDFVQVKITDSWEYDLIGEVA